MIYELRGATLYLTYIVFVPNVIKDYRGTPIHSTFSFQEYLNLEKVLGSLTCFSKRNIEFNKLIRGLNCLDVSFLLNFSFGC